MVYAVIIAGGEGKRLWPKSNKFSPKHPLSFTKGSSLLEETFKRISLTFPKNKIIVVTTRKNLKDIKSLLSDLEEENFLVEPVGKNTAPAVCLAAFVLQKRDPDAIMAVFPADHIIGDQENFFDALNNAVEVVRKTEMLGTIGIAPTYPATGYGYIKIGSGLGAGGWGLNYFKVEKFIEKPNLAKAKIYAKSKEYFWNSGIFIWKVSSILNALKKFNSQLYNKLRRIQDKENISKIYRTLKDISIDYCVLEKAKNVFTIIGDFDWIDLGSWIRLENLYKKDRFGNIVLAEHKGINTQDSIVVGESGHLIGTIGVKDLIIVQTKNATLICNKNSAEEVKRLLVI